MHDILSVCGVVLSLQFVVLSGVSGQIQLANETAEAPTTALPVVSEHPKLPLAIHYEVLCPDSMYFIRRRLYDALISNDWWDRADLKLYPFGKAAFYNNTKIGELQVFCQHGDEECELNALHACVLEHLELRQAFKLIYCMLRSYGNYLDMCAAHLGIDVVAVKECKETRNTADILQPYGRETLALEISFVPSIVINNKFEPYEQSSIRYNFQAHFCRQYERQFQIKLPTCG